MRLFMLLVIALQVSAQTITLPNEWKKLSHGALLTALDDGKYPFLVRRLTMSSVDPAFRAAPGPQQEEILWQVEKKIAETRGRKPVVFLIWDSDQTRYCDQIAIDGDTYQVIVFPPLMLAVTFSHDGGQSTAYVYARLAENSKIRVNILPQYFRMAEVQPKLQVQGPIPPQRIAGKVKSRARWTAALSRIAGSLQTKTITTQSTTTARGYDSGRFSLREQWGGRQWQGTYSGTSTGNAYTTTTTTVPDYEARARAEANAQMIEARAAERADEISGGALRPTTLLPGSSVYGAVYFKRDKKANFSVLAIPVGGFQFEFGVQWNQ